MDENYDVCDDYKDGNEGLKDPGRQERRRPDEPTSVKLISNTFLLIVPVY